MLKAIVFDFDGVIADSEPLHYDAFRWVAESIGVRLDYAIYTDELIGYDDRDVVRTLLAKAGRVADERRVSTLVEDKGRAFARVARKASKPIPGVLRFIGEASKRLPLAISSGAKKADIDLILDGLGLAGRFDPIIASDDVFQSKPDPQCYRLAVEGLVARHPQLGLRPDNCLAIEDTPAGLRAARNAGLWTLGLTTNLPAENLYLAHRIAPSFVGLTLDRVRQWYRSD